MRFRRISSHRLSRAAVLLCAALGFAVSGCHEDAMVKNLATDNAYIRMPEDLDKGAIQPGPGDVFPEHPGNHWTLKYAVAGKNVTEQITDNGPTTVNGHIGEELQVLDDNGKPPRTEVYTTDGGSVNLLASGEANAVMQMSPAIPLYHSPVKQGDEIEWEGVLHLKGRTSPATALSRVTGAMALALDSGKFDAYRIDTIVTTTINGQTAAFPMTRWITPGVGMVQERVLVGREASTKTLTSYHVAGKN